MRQGAAEADAEQKTSPRMEPETRASQPPQAGGVSVHSKAPPRRRRLVRVLLLVLGPVVVALGATYVYATGGRFVGTDNAYVKADKVMIAAVVSGAITEVAVAENAHVEAGQVLFRIDEDPYRFTLAEAAARLESFRAEIAGIKATYRQKEAELALARTNLMFADKEFDRQSSLFASNVASRSKFDATRRDLDVARHHEAAVVHELAEIRARLGGDPTIQVDQHPRVLAALAIRDRAVRDLVRTAVRAPFAGIAGNVPKQGHYATAGVPVMSVVADRNVWIEANFKETDLTYVQPGQSAEVRVDTYPGQVWKGSVDSVSQATGAEFSIIPPQNATGNWVKVVQRIPVRITVMASEGNLPLRAGMSADIEIDTGHRRPLHGFFRSALWLLNDGSVPAAHSRGVQ